MFALRARLRLLLPLHELLLRELGIVGELGVITVFIDVAKRGLEARDHERGVRRLRELHHLSWRESAGFSCERHHVL